MNVIEKTRKYLTISYGSGEYKRAMRFVKKVIGRSRYAVVQGAYDADSDTWLSRYRIYPGSRTW